MSETTEKKVLDELSKLLWCYNTTPTPKEVSALQSFLEEKKISSTVVLSVFKHTCEETHSRAINTMSYIATKVFVSLRNIA